MEELINDLITVLDKHKAKIFVEQEEDDSFLYLQLHKNDKSISIDSGYRDLEINSNSLKRKLK